MILGKYGFNNEISCAFEAGISAGHVPARIIAEHKSLYRVVSEFGEQFAEISGKYRYQLEEIGGYPTVGDWVALERGSCEGRGLIHNLLPRKTLFSRKDPWSADGLQVVAANFDTVFICTSLNKNFNLRRIERYLVLSWESGAVPVIILSKADLCEDVAEKLIEVEAIAPGVPIHVVSALNKTGLDELQSYISSGKTIAILGSSGVGKSTLINALAGQEIMKTSEVREDDDMGRHTTTHRQLVLLPQGGLFLDTPGMRELGMTDAADGLSDAFADIEEIAAGCKFGDCKHQKEPGCAVKEALADGVLDLKRYDNYLKLRKETRHMESKDNINRRLSDKKKMKEIARQFKNLKKERMKSHAGN